MKDGKGKEKAKGRRTVSVEEIRSALTSKQPRTVVAVLREVVISIVVVLPPEEAVPRTLEFVIGQSALGTQKFDLAPKRHPTFPQAVPLATVIPVPTTQLGVFLLKPEGEKGGKGQEEPLFKRSSFVRLPADGKPRIMVTTQLSACTIILHPVPEGNTVEIVHVQPGELNGRMHSGADTSSLLRQRLGRHVGKNGVIFGPGKKRGQGYDRNQETVTIFGARFEDGWQIFAQYALLVRSPTVAELWKIYPGKARKLFPLGRFRRLFSSDVLTG